MTLSEAKRKAKSLAKAGGFILTEKRSSKTAEVNVEAPHGYTLAGDVHERINEITFSSGETLLDAWLSAIEDMQNADLTKCEPDCEWCYPVGEETEEGERR